MTLRNSQGDTLYTLTTWANHRREEIHGLLLFSTSALVLSSVGRPEGEVGRVVLVLTEGLGFGIVYPPLVLALWGVRKFQHREAYRDRSELLAWGLNLPLLLGALEVVHHGTGGTLGFWISAYLAVLAGPWGALILIGTAAVITVCHCLELSPRQLGRRVLRMGRDFVVGPMRKVGGAGLWGLTSFQRLVYLAIKDVWIIINLLSRQLGDEVEAPAGGERTPFPGAGVQPSPRETPLPVEERSGVPSEIVPARRRPATTLGGEAPPIFRSTASSRGEGIEDPLLMPRVARAASLRRGALLPETPSLNHEFPIFVDPGVEAEGDGDPVRPPAPPRPRIRARRLLPAVTDLGQGAAPEASSSPVVPAVVEPAPAPASAQEQAPVVAPLVAAPEVSTPVVEAPAVPEAPVAPVVAAPAIQAPVGPAPVAPAPVVPVVAAPEAPATAVPSVVVPPSSNVAPATPATPAAPAAPAAPAGPALEVARPQEHLPSSSELLEEVRAEEEKARRKRKAEPYVLPSLDLFNSPPTDLVTESDEELARKAELITVTLGHFGIASEITRVTCGPSITQFELKPAAGVKLSKLTSLSDDLAMALAVASVRIEAPIPGRGAVGIEVPNEKAVPVFFQEMAAQRKFRKSKAPLSYVMGKGISGNPVVADLHKAPHMLVAGATGAGKSVCMNAIISSMLMRNSPEELKMILIDPKMVEMMIYDGIAHLVTPVITDPKAASAALQWAVLEMERRYKLLSKAGYRNIEGFNKAVRSGEVTSESVGGPPDDSRFGPLPYMVIVIDELADLMMVAAKDIEESICRIAQMARAVGMHLIVATQRPSTNVITGIIKANLPTRVAFRVASRVDSKVILDHTGAEALLGKGDMLFQPVGQPKPVRIQGAFIEEDEIKRLVAHIKEHCEPEYEDIVAAVQEEELAAATDLVDVEDEYLGACIRFAVEKGEVSTSLLQRHFKIGYNRAACIVDVMEARGILSGAESGRRRKVIVSGGELEAILASLQGG